MHRASDQVPDAAATVGQFTTYKLQALFDSGLAPALRSRASLAEALKARGERISVHGIDAWFKRTDSNYSALTRPSLHPDHLSFAIPAKRWPAVLAAFDLHLQDLERDDAGFRAWCFSRSTPLDVVLVHATDDAPLAEPEAQLLSDAGIEVHVPLSTTQALEGPGLRVLRQAAAVLVYLPAGPADPPLREVLGVLAREDLPWLAVHLDATSQLPDEVTPGASIARHAQPRDSYRRDLLQAVRHCAVPPEERTQSETTWSSPPLVTDRPSIAVLPLTALAADPDHAALADGITEDVINLLARTPEVFVISHSTSRAFAGRATDYREVREQLGVRYLLEGTLRARGNRLRVAVQLTDTYGGTTVWGDHFDRTDADPFEVQDDLATAILAQIEPRLRLADMASAGRGSNPTAWRLWQEGWHLLFVDAPQPIPERSLALFREALELDPDYPLAHAGLVVALGTGVLWGGLPNRVLGEVQTHAELAYRALPDSSAVHYAMAMANFAKAGSERAALEHVERAVALEPGNPMYHGIRGYLLANQGNAQEGRQACEYAVRLSPRDARGPFLSYMLGTACVAGAEYAEGLEVLGMCRHFGDSEVDFVWLITAFAQFQLGARDQALASLQRIPRPRPRAFYEWAVREHLWRGVPSDERHAFLSLLPEAGIG